MMLSWLSLPAGEGKQPTVLIWVRVWRTELQMKQGRVGNNIHGACHQSSWCQGKQQQVSDGLRLKEGPGRHRPWRDTLRGTGGGSFLEERGSFHLDNNLTCNFPLFLLYIFLGLSNHCGRELFSILIYYLLNLLPYPCCPFYSFARQVFFPLKSEVHLFLATLLLSFVELIEHFIWLYVIFS